MLSGKQFEAHRNKVTFSIVLFYATSRLFLHMEYMPESNLQKALEGKLGYNI